jgi:ClpP class serine protease
MRDERCALLEELKTARGSDLVISYITNTRPGFAAVMSLDAVRRFAEHMPSERVNTLDLFLHTDGGEATVPWRLMTYLREYAEVVNVLVPYRAFSAGTLTALGADSIVMHPMGMLGPIDPTVHDPYGPRDEETGQQHGVGVEDVAAFTSLIRDDFGITSPTEMIEAARLLAERVHPLTLGHVKRGTQQARMLGEKLLRSRNEPPAEEEIGALLDELTRRLYFHGHPINRREADKLGLPI